jgi:hypothetical protein
MKNHSRGDLSFENALNNGSRDWNSTTMQMLWVSKGLTCRYNSWSKVEYNRIDIKSRFYGILTYPVYDIL